MSQAVHLRLATAVAAVPVLLLVPAWSDAVDETAPGAPVEAGPGAPTFQLRAGEPAQYSIGEPTDEEQVLLELMNRARLDPVGEGDRIFRDYDSSRVTQGTNFFLQQRPGVEWTRAENRDAFHGYPAKPPLAFNAKLVTAARAHSQLLRQNDSQSHLEPGEKILAERLADAGYVRRSVAESVYSFADSMIHAHAAFAIDYGQSTLDDDGRPVTGHRRNLMGFDGDPDHDYTEVGIGVLSDASAATKVGPLLVTIDFGIPANEPKVFLTGVCYDDKNANGLYDGGEGLGGVRIEVQGEPSFAVSSASGGYAVPITVRPTTIHVTATGQPGTPGESVGTQTREVAVGTRNVKVDFNRPPDPPIPQFAELAVSTPAPIPDVGTAATSVFVPLADPYPDVVGDVKVDIDITHTVRSELKATLVGPNGTEVVLFDHGPPGDSLHGVFDSSLAPRESLDALIGGPFNGVWTLRVEDTQTGAQGVVTRWKLQVRPQWVRKLASRASPLFVTKLKVKDSTAPAADTAQFSAQVDTQGVALDASAPCDLRLFTTGATRVELLHATIPPTAIQYAVKGTSRTLVKSKLSGLDLDGALPSEVEVELSIGGAIVGARVPLVKGSFDGAKTRPSSELFRVDSLSTKGKGAVRTYTVKGRIKSTAPLVGGGTLEISLGDFRFKGSMTSVTVKGAKATAKSTATVKKLTLDTVKGTFLLVVATDADVLPGTATELSLRLGEDGFFGSTRIVPSENGPSLTY